MSERRLPTREEVLDYVHQRRHGRRWGQDDQESTRNSTGSPANPMALLSVAAL